MFTAPFEGPRLKIERAKSHHNHLRDMVATFSKDTEIHWIGRDLEMPDGGSVMEVCYRFTKQPPSEIPLLIGDIVHNLRSALDILMCDVARLSGKGTSGVKFPFAENAEKLEKILQAREMAHLGGEVLDLIRYTAPYKGGNIGLRGLHDLDIADKHKLIIPTYIVAYTTMRVPDFANQMFQQFLGIDLSRSRVPIHEGVWSAMSKDYDPAQFFNPPPNGPEPAFGPDLPFAGEPVLKTLEDLSQLALEIVNLFASKLVARNLNP